MPIPVVDMFARRERREIQRLAEEATVLHQRIAELERELQRRRDRLTGLLALEPFHELLVTEVRRAARHDRPLTLVLLRLDRLADIQAEHGFTAADRVLAQSGRLIRAASRREDVLARSGPDEFALLLPDTDEQAALACAERLLLELEVLEVGKVHCVSASAGVAALGQGRDPVVMLAQAGRALAEARTAGGGRMVVAQGDDREPDVAARLGREDAVDALAHALLARDNYTGEHSKSVVEMTCAVARALGLGREESEHVRAAALLHDIGKMGIPDAILNKPGPLTDAERATMAEHPVIGERILRVIPGMGPVARIVRHEHESWDGSGYPDGLAGEAIPIGSRIILACDAYHAMTSDRPYRAAMSHADAIGELRRCAGAQFDANVTEALLGYLYGWRQIHGALPAGTPAG